MYYWRFSYLNTKKVMAKTLAKTIYFLELLIINSAIAHYLYIALFLFHFQPNYTGITQMKTISKYLFVSLFAPSVPFHFLADDDIRGYSPSVVGVWPSPLSSRPQTMASLRGLSCVRSVGGSLRTLKTISSLSACFTVGHL